MIICGIDPGTATTGFGVLEKTKQGLKCLDYGAIITSKDEPQEVRLNKLYNQMTRLLAKHQPKVLVVEKLFFFKNLKTALPVSEAKGVILLSAAKKKIKIIELTPLEIKMNICNYGRADKKQVAQMVKKLLDLDKIPRPDDAADALAAAICGARVLKH